MSRKSNQMKFKQRILRVLHVQVPHWVQEYKGLSDIKLSMILNKVRGGAITLGHKDLWDLDANPENETKIREGLTALAQQIAIQSFEEGGVLFMGTLFKNRRTECAD